MSLNTVERYRLSVKIGNRRYKLLAHQVLEDETLSIELRSQPRKQHVVSGRLEALSGEFTISSDVGYKDGRAHHVHYHPSGRLRIKAFDGVVIRELSFPPLPLLHVAIPLFLLSAASVDQLDEDEKAPRLGDHVVDLDEMPVKRLQCVAWIGPKGSFSALSPMSVPAQKIVYEDAGLYDVAYIISEGVPITASVSHKGIPIRDTRITAVPADSIPSPKTLPNVGPEYWASPNAIARQLRAALEDEFKKVKQMLGGNQCGAWEVRISLCKDGFIAALDWNYTLSTPGYSIAEWYQLSVGDVLGVLGNAGPELCLKDVSEIDSRLTGGLPNTCFVRLGQTKSESSKHNAIVFLPAEHLRDRYYRIPRVALKHLSEIISIVDSK
jgi:hypothetical protein